MQARATLVKLVPGSTRPGWFGYVQCNTDENSVKHRTTLEVDETGGHLKSWWDCIQNYMEALPRAERTH